MGALNYRVGSPGAHESSSESRQRDAKKNNCDRREGDKLIASAPPNIAGKLEIRGIGIVDMETVSDVPVALYVELTSEIMRLPDDRRERPVLGVNLPLVSIDALTASAASKVALALDRLGLKL